MYFINNGLMPLIYDLCYINTLFNRQPVILIFYIQFLYYMAVSKEIENTILCTFPVFHLCVTNLLTFNLKFQFSKPLLTVWQRVALTIKVTLKVKLLNQQIWSWNFSTIKYINKCMRSFLLSKMLCSTFSF